MVVYVHVLELSLLRYVTVIYNKKMRKMEISYNLPEFLSPKFDVEVVNDAATRSSTLDPHALTQTFGSVWSKKYLRDLDQSLAHTSAVSDATVLQKVACGQTALANDKEKLGQSEMKSGINGDKVTQHELVLPPFDQKTLSVAQIFPIQKIVPPALASCLAKEAKALSDADESVRNQWLTEGTYPRLIVDRLPFLPIDNPDSVDQSGSGTKRKRKSRNSTDRPVTRLGMATHLALLGHMIKMFQLKPRELQRRTPLPDTPHPLANHLLNEFTVFASRSGNERSKSRLMTPILRDKLICHILVLLLHCDNFATVIDALPSDFKMSSVRLKNHFAFIGCSFSKQEVETSSTDQKKEGAKQYHTVARLSAPLVLKAAHAFKR
ncbi:unnamed protein product [Hydatigera taeniaeformis]|uniref:DNA-directed RNA polymerase I subunit rpa49 n=1 Tax=Hydatigena taeniaeformis TaxID=6205 RepID=A0A0R3WT96_HYDTA|nr:unnamed protein product [Hydatigera taeniaeformis]